MGEYKGIHFFPYFSLKHRLWVLVGTAVPKINVLSENKKNIICFSSKNIIFTTVKIRWILHRHVCVMKFQKETIKICIIYIFMVLQVCKFNDLTRKHAYIIKARTNDSFRSKSSKMVNCYANKC